MLLPGRRIHSAAAMEGLEGRARSDWARRTTELGRGFGGVQAVRASAVLSREQSLCQPGLLFPEKIAKITKINNKRKTAKREQCACTRDLSERENNSNNKIKNRQRYNAI